LEDYQMPLTSKYLFIASMDVDKEKDQLFQDVYDQDHIPHLMEVPGVISVARYKKVPLSMYIGGQKKEMVFESEPRYHAYYELESPEVLLTSEWNKAVEKGRWPAQVRPYTKNRRHIMTERIENKR
jgi:hypothetical protein